MKHKSQGCFADPLARGCVLAMESTLSRTLQLIVSQKNSENKKTYVCDFYSSRNNHVGTIPNFRNAQPAKESPQHGAAYTNARSQLRNMTEVVNERCFSIATPKKHIPGFVNVVEASRVANLNYCNICNDGLYQPALRKLRHGKRPTAVAGILNEHLKKLMHSGKGWKHQCRDS